MLWLPESSPRWYYFKTYSELTGPKLNFLRSLTYWFLGRSVHRKNAIFVQNFPKTAYKRVVFWPVFSKNCLQRRKFAQNRVFLVMWKSSENLFGNPKKSRSRFFNASPPPPPPEKVLDPALLVTFISLCEKDQKWYGQLCSINNRPREELEKSFFGVSAFLFGPEFSNRLLL